MKSSPMGVVPAAARAREPGRSRVWAFLPPALRERLASHCAAAATAESAVVTAALHQYFENAGDKELVLRRLDRLDQAVGHTLRALDLQCEAFAVFMKIWFAHTPSVGADGRRAALALSENRYRQFVEYVAARMASGARLARDLPRERPAGEDRQHPAAAGQTADAAPQPGTGAPGADEGHGPG
ncbi:MAG TPA: hypothetical protein VEK07_08545 [Polyangiaceae bacterium]|nr:hypothetical protein [Polyangiaceae bacterium]